MRHTPTVLALGIALFLTACGTPQGPSGGRRPLAVVEIGGKQGLSSENRAAFQAQLNESLFGEDGAFTPRDGGSVLRWHASEVDEGSRALRYFVGFGAGRGIFRARGTLVAPGGRAIASTDVRGTQTMGVYGGTYDDAVTAAAEDLADWAATHANSLPSAVVRERAW